jgi:hypothetical protein
LLLRCPPEKKKRKREKKRNEIKIAHTFKRHSSKRESHDTRSTKIFRIREL